MCVYFCSMLISFLVGAISNDNQYNHPSVIYSAEFSFDKRYRINQAECLYPEAVTLANGKPMQEKSIGCQNKCLFCNYTWSRKHIGELQGVSGSFGEDDKEKTINELDLNKPDSWGQLRMVGLDGTSERLRYMVSKRISKERLQEFLKALSRRKAQQLKSYCIVGYPTEGEDDFRELIETIKEIDTKLKPINPQYCLAFNFSHFRPMPCTPAAWWPTQYKNYRGEIAKLLRKYKLCRADSGKSIFYQGNAYWAIETMGTDSIVSAMLDMLCIRGIEQDADIIKRLAVFGKFWSSNTATKQKTLEKYVDMDRLFRAYSQKDYPVRYLESYVSSDKMYQIGQRAIHSDKTFSIN